MAQWEHRSLESGVVSSNPVLYIFLRIKLFDFSLSFLLFFINFEVKQCANIYWKYDNKDLQWKRSQAFLFLKIANTPHKGTIRHIAWLHASSFLFKIHCFLSKWKWSCTWWPTLFKRKRNTLCLTTFLNNYNSSCPWYTSSFNWKSSFVLIYYKSVDGYPNFSFSYLLLITLLTNSTFIIWLKKYS